MPVSRSNPQIMAAIIASVKGSSNTGTINVMATKDFVTNAEIVEIHICLFVLFLSDSSEMCIARASDPASAIAIIIITPITASRDLVLAFIPTIDPRIVMTTELNPKLMPVLRALCIAWIVIRVGPRHHHIAHSTVKIISVPSYGHNNAIRISFCVSIFFIFR